jgi:4-aminobutyrate aminotransferase-like enzyme
LLCVDEVQTCMGRCGEMFAIELWDNIDADLLLLGKAFAAGGQPIAAILGTDEVMANSDLHLGSTYGFQPAAAAAAIEGIRIIQEGGVLENVRELQRIFFEEMQPLKQRVEQVGDVRASGALAALEFVQSKETITPAPAFQYAVYQAVLKRGVLGITQHGKWHYRLQPALTMPPEVFRDSCHRIIEAVEEVAANPPVETSVLDMVADG